MTTPWVFIRAFRFFFIDPTSMGQKMGSLRFTEGWSKTWKNDFLALNHHFFDKKITFFEFWIDLYRRIFWRGIRIWRYFLKKVAPLGVKIMFFYRKPIFENWVSNKKSILHPFGVNFLPKITSGSDSSSKNTSVWVNPKVDKSGFCTDLSWFS